MLRFVAFSVLAFSLAPCFGLRPAQQQEFHGSMSLEWKGISYSVLVRHGRKLQKKQILHDLSGKAEPGHLVAIMGPTGRCLSHFKNHFYCFSQTLPSLSPFTLLIPHPLSDAKQRQDHAPQRACRPHPPLQRRRPNGGDPRQR